MSKFEIAQSEFDSRTKQLIEHLITATKNGRLSWSDATCGYITSNDEFSFLIKRGLRGGEPAIVLTVRDEAGERVLETFDEGDSVDISSSRLQQLMDLAAANETDSRTHSVDRVLNSLQKAV